MESNLVYTDEQYDNFDKILNSGIYYLHSLAKDYDSLTIINFDSKDDNCLVLYELATQYCSIFNKTLYLDMSLFLVFPLLKLVLCLYLNHRYLNNGISR